jgi:hypothetical protein
LKRLHFEQEGDMVEEKAGRKRMGYPRASALDLRGRQSVRATFRLSRGAIETLSMVAVHLEIKQKSLFDHLIDDKACLDAIAQDLQPDEFKTSKRVQKTYVLNRRTLSCLEEISNRYGVPRDALVEYSIQRLAPIIEEERGRHQMRKEILEEMECFVEKGANLLDKMEKTLGSDDRVYRKLEAAMGMLQNTKAGLEAFVERGKILEETRLPGAE